MPKLAQTIMNRIKKEQRTPLFWSVWIKRIIVWLLITISILAASLFLGTMLAELLNAQWQLAPRWPGQELGFLKDAIGWFWVIGAAIALIGGVFAFRCTRRGYRYGALLIILLLALTSIATGGALLRTSLPEAFHSWHDHSFPPIVEVSRFQNPEEGRLMGEITEISSSKTAYLQDSDGTKWELWFFEDEGGNLATDDFVEVFGEQVDDSTFAVLSLQIIPSDHFVQGFGKGMRMSR